MPGRLGIAGRSLIIATCAKSRRASPVRPPPPFSSPANRRASARVGTADVPPAYGPAACGPNHVSRRMRSGKIAAKAIKVRDARVLPSAARRLGGKPLRAGRRRQADPARLLAGSQRPLAGAAYDAGHRHQADRRRKAGAPHRHPPRPFDRRDPEAGDPAARAAVVTRDRHLRRIPGESRDPPAGARAAVEWVPAFAGSAAVVALSNEAGESVREALAVGRKRALREGTNVFRVLVKAPFKAGIVTERTIHVYFAWLDTEALEAEGDAIAADGI